MTGQCVGATAAHAIQIDPSSAATVIAGLVVLNAGAMLAAYVSIKVNLAVLTEKTTRMETDINNLAGIIRGDGTVRGSASKI